MNKHVIYTNTKSCKPCRILHSQLSYRDDIEWREVLQGENLNSFSELGLRSVPALVTDEGYIVGVEGISKFFDGKR